METHIAKYILDILRTNPYVVMSWGAHDFRAVKDGLGFYVHGFVFDGWIEVVFNEARDLFEIWKIANGVRTIAQEDVYADEIISVIDALVEKNCSQEEYKSRINAEYGY